MGEYLNRSRIQITSFFVNYIHKCVRIYLEAFEAYFFLF